MEALLNMSGTIIAQAVTFTIGKEEYGIPIREVFEIILVPELTEIPKAPESVVGVINLRGLIIPVIDLRLQLGRAREELSKKQRIIITRSKDKMIGLLVDAVNQVLRIEGEQLDAMPEAIVTADTSYIEAIYKMAERIIILLRMDRLLDPIQADFIQRNT
jgi:purine-binding chemotaxis protein CheW